MTVDNKYFWASSITGIFKVRLEEDKMVPVGYKFRDFNFAYHGAYAYLADNGVYFISGNTYIAAYTNKNASDPESEIILARRYDVPGLRSDEHVLGLCLTYDDYMVFATNYGRIGVVS